MARRPAAARQAATLATTLMIAAICVRFLSLPLPPGRWWALLGLGLAGAVYAVVALRLVRHDSPVGDLAAAGHGIVPSAIAGGILVLGSPYLGRIDVVAILLFTAIHLGAPASARLRGLIAGGVIVDAVFAGVWLSWPNPDVGTLVFAIAFMAALQMVVLAQAKAAGADAETDKMRSSARAATAERVGTAIDVLGVARAVLETTRSAYPMTTHAGLMLYDPGSDRLRPLPLFLGRDGVGPLDSDSLDIAFEPGQGIVGKIFAASRPMLWSTAADVHLAQSNIDGQARAQLRELVPGVTLSAIGAPLLVDDEVIGVYVLTSHRQELVWGEEDLSVVAALAGEAARALERARRYERELDQAHLDSITGLANHRQLTRTLDQEVARARRRSTSLGVVFCDLDRFKAVNDTYGHAAGDRVLTILAHVFHDSLRREDSAARYGGDEFVCVLPGADREETEAVGRRISTSFEARIREDSELSSAGATISCGLAIFPDDGDDVASLLQYADAAMRVVKIGRRANVPEGWRAS